MKQVEQLSTEQIQHLTAFTKKRFVKYEDVRFEIVDHLASDIEAQLAESPQLEFDQALKNAYNNFPTRYFSRFVTEKEKALSKYWNRRILKLLLGYFTLPRILLTLTIFFATYYSITSGWIAANYFGFGTAIIVQAFSYFFLFKQFKDLKKSYLIIDVFKSRLMVYTSLIILFYSIGDTSLMNTESIYTTAIVMTFTSYITLNLILTFALVTGEIKHLLLEEVTTNYKHLEIAL